MPLVIRQIAENVRQREYQHSRMLGCNISRAAEMAYDAYCEVLALGRAGILESSK